MNFSAALAAEKIKGKKKRDLFDEYGLKDISRRAFLSALNRWKTRKTEIHLPVKLKQIAVRDDLTRARAAFAGAFLSVVQPRLFKRRACKIPFSVCLAQIQEPLARFLVVHIVKPFFGRLRDILVAIRQGGEMPDCFGEFIPALRKILVHFRISFTPL
jgi:hypothetical protein